MKDLTSHTGTTVTSQTLKKKQNVTLKNVNRMHVQTRPQKSNALLLGDISGSMYGTKLDALKICLTDCWRPGIRAFVFESDVFEITEQDIPNLQEMGSTNMLEVLEEAWQTDSNHFILMTDGQPDQYTSEILDMVRQNAKKAKIDTIGIGDQGSYNYDRDFLQELAEITGGKFYDVGEPIKLGSVVQELLEWKGADKLDSGPAPSGGVIEL